MIQDTVIEGLKAVKSDQQAHHRSTQPLNSSVPHGEKARSRPRLVRLLVILVTCFTVVPASALLVLFLSRSKPADTKVNINISTPPPPAISPTPAIKLRPPAAPQSPVRSLPPQPMPSPLIKPLAPAKTANARVPPSPSPLGVHNR